MLSSFRNRFGIPGVISVIALVFAMLGGAYAASNSDSGKATASAKAKQGPRGKPGKPGPAGSAGPAGPQGPAGPAGVAGAKGDKGDAGTAGSAGTANPSPGYRSLPANLPPTTKNARKAGIEYTSASGVNVVCKGEEGLQGPTGPAGATGATGSPGPTCPGGQCVPPVGSSLTGVWSFRAINVAKRRLASPTRCGSPGAWSSTTSNTKTRAP